VGKTWLLRKMHREALGAPNLLLPDDIIDMYSTQNHSIEGIQASIVELLDGASEQPSVFDQFIQYQHELEVGIQEDFSLENLTSMRQQVDRAFFDSCSRLSKEVTPILFLDTFERVQGDIVGDWIMRDLVRHLPSFLFVIASREPWKGSDFVSLTPLDGLKQDEIDDYRRMHGLSQDTAPLFEVIYAKTQGHPLLMELAVEWLHGELLQNPDKLKRLSWEYFIDEMLAPLREMGRGMPRNLSEDRVVEGVLPFMAYMNRRFDAELLRRLRDEGAIQLGSHTPGEVIELLKKLPYVKTRPDGVIQLHDEMERWIVEQLWPSFDSSGQFRRELAAVAIQWYDNLIRDVDQEIELDDLRAERLGYVLRGDPQAGLQEFFNIFDSSFHKQRLGLCETIVTEIRRQDSSAYPTVQRYKLLITLNKLNYTLARYQQMVPIAQEMKRLGEAAGNLDWQIGALFELHTATWREDVQEGLGYLREAYTLCEWGRPASLPRVMYLIGFTYSMIPNLKEAEKWYMKCIQESQRRDEHKYRASAIAELGYVYLTMEEHEKAGQYSRRALALRKKMLDRNPHSRELERQICWSYHILGSVSRHAGELSEAEIYYEKAVALAHKVHDLEFEAMSSYFLAETQRRMAQASERRGDRDEALRYREQAHENFARSHNLYSRYGLTRGIGAYYRCYGRLLLDEGELESAQRQFQEGIRVTKAQGNVYEMLKNIVELAFVTADRQDRELLNQLRRETEACRDQVIQGKLFPLIIDIAEAEFFFNQEEYDKALAMYIEGFTGLASDPGYGTVQYRVYKDRFMRHLAALPEPEHHRKWCRKMSEAWTQAGLDETHSDLIGSCQLHLLTMDV
jgi:tetratricopeptide (TPR) repeat protein